MNDLIKETNSILEEAIVNLFSLKSEYEKKLLTVSEEIGMELTVVEKYKKDFYKAKEKINKMNDDINKFEDEYQSLVDKYQNDELSNILISANKEISTKIEEKRKKINDDKIQMNKLAGQANVSKQKLVKLTAEKRAIEMKLNNINEAYNYYNARISDIIDFSNTNPTKLSSFFDTDSKPVKEDKKEDKKKKDKEPKKEEKKTKEIVIVDKSDEEEEKEIKKETKKEEPKLQEDLEKIVSEAFDFNDSLNLDEFINFDDSIPD